MKMVRWTLVMVLSIGLTGCLSVKSYLDPRYSTASYAEINPVSEKHPVNLEVEFQQNGVYTPSAGRMLWISMERSFRTTGVVELNSSAPTTISVIVNLTDVEEAGAKEFGTGPRLGLTGSVAQVYFKVLIELKQDNGRAIRKNYKHIMHTTIGNAAAPFADVIPTSTSVAFHMAIEDIVLNFVKDMQAENLLSLNGSVNPDKTAAAF